MARPRFVTLISGYTLLGFLPIGINFLLVPLYTTHLAPEQYGVLSEANVTLTFTQLAVALGLDSSFARYYFDYEKDRSGIDHLFGAVVGAILAVTAGLALVLALVGPALYDALWTDLPFERYGMLILVAALQQSVVSLMFMLHRNGENLTGAAAVSLLTTIGAAIGTAVALTQFEATAFGAFLGKTVGGILGLAPAAFPVFKRTGLALDLALTRKMLAFGLPLIAYSLLAYVLFNGDRVLMQRWFTLEDLGLYALAATLVSALEIVLQAGQQAVQPSLYRALTARAANATALVQRFYVTVVGACVIALVALVLGAEWILLLLRGDRYLGATRYVAVLAYAQLFRVVFNAYSVPLYFVKRTGPLGLVTGAAIPVGLGAAFATRELLGPLSIAVGVLAWKAAQQCLTWAAMRQYAPDARVSMGPAFPIVAGAGIWIAACQGAPAMPPTWSIAIRFGGGIALALWGTLVAAKEIRGSSEAFSATRAGTEAG